MKKAVCGLLILAGWVGFLFAEDFKEKTSTHFIVYYEGVPEEFADTVIEYGERYYDTLTEKLGFTRYAYWTWDNRAKIYIYADQESYVKATKQPAWTGGVAAYDQKTIWSFPRESGFFDSLLPHEIGHIVFREVVGGSRRVPLWLEEGVASYLEQAKRFGSEKLVVEALEKGTFIPFKDLNAIDGQELRMRSDVDLFYAESVTLVNFLIGKFGISPFNEFCRKLKEGKSLDDALNYAYFDIRSAAKLSEVWEDQLRNKIKAKSKTIL
jgi:hypothetical protein